MEDERRAQLRVALAFLLGALLIALPLYFFRRSRNAPIESATTAAEAGPSSDAGAADAAIADAATSTVNVTVGGARVLECHDQGSAKTAPADCDHPATIEAALASAIVASASCAHGEAGTIGYEVDLSFLRKRNPLEITAPHDERTLKSNRAAKACTVDVKRTLLAVIDPDGGVPHPAIVAAMATAPHAHGRYRLLVTATYAAP